MPSGVFSSENRGRNILPRAYETLRRPNRQIPICLFVYTYIYLTVYDQYTDIARTTKMKIHRGNRMHGATERGGKRGSVLRRKSSISLSIILYGREEKKKSEKRASQETDTRRKERLEVETSGSRGV